MKQIIFSIILTVIVVFATKAQQPQHNFEWAKRLTPNGLTTVRMITSPLGDLYTIASPETDETYDYYANTKNFITKFNTQGDTLWTKQINNHNPNSANNDYSVYAEDLALDNAGNLYIAGWFMQTVDFDPGVGTYLLSSDTWVNGFNNIYGRDAFVMKLNAQGDFVWAKKYSQGGAFNERFYSLALDNAGSIYAAGASNMSANYGMLYKINVNNGNLIWKKDITANKPRVTLDNIKSIYLTDYFSGTCDFDPDATTYHHTASGDNDMCITKLDSAGHFVWANRLGGTGSDKGKSLTIDTVAGNVFVTGYYTGAATYTLNGTTAATLPTNSSVSWDGFIAKLNATNGNFLWVSSWRNAPNQSGALYDIGKGVTLDQNKNVYVTGKAFTSPTNPYNTYDGITNFGQTYNGHGRTDIAVFKLNNTTGNFTWIKIIGGSGEDGGIDIGADATDNIYIAGSYSGTVNFDPSPNNVYNLTAGGRFLMKMGLRNFTTISHSMCENETYDFMGSLLTNAGIYHDTLINVAGYDSIITLTLNVLPIATDSLFVTINQGDVYNFNGSLLNTSGIYTDTLTSTNGCDSLLILTLSVEVTTGINDVLEGKTFKIYPNPTEGKVYFSETVNTQVTNALGQIITDKKNVNSLDLTIHPTGVYFIILTDDKGQIKQRSKIVKE